MIVSLAAGERLSTPALRLLRCHGYFEGRQAAALVLFWLPALGELEVFWQELPAEQAAAVQILAAFMFSVDFVLTLFLYLKMKERGKKKTPMSTLFFF